MKDHNIIFFQIKAMLELTLEFSLREIPNPLSNKVPTQIYASKGRASFARIEVLDPNRVRYGFNNRVNKRLLEEYKEYLKEMGFEK